MDKGKILVVDDNQGIRSALKILLPPHFGDVEAIASPATLVSNIETFKPDVVLLDMNFFSETNSGNEGLYWTTEIKKMRPHVEVVLFTAYADIALAVEGMRRGAFDFIVKPWDNDKLIATLVNAVQRSKPSSKAGSSQTSETFWGVSAAMQELKMLVEKIAPTDASILITGENGTGKDVLANEIHRLSRRSSRQMVCVDAGAITETLFESELFGHVKGAFTDAKAERKGYFEIANGGTLFLDEVGELPLPTQVRLLRVLETGEFIRMGSSQIQKTNVRVVAATNLDMPRAISEGRFREDLYYRLNTVEIKVPALRERKEDIPELVQYFLEQICSEQGIKAKTFTPEALQTLHQRTWPGNIRELRNVVERLIILTGEAITKTDVETYA